MVATVARSGAGFVTSNIRTYEVWGGVRTGASTGGPKGRYVANLGHVQDDESGLIYMRARYYEPESGRFISEDPAAHGDNWFIYANSDPVTFVDSSGLEPLQVLLVSVIGKNLYDKLIGELVDFGVRSVARLINALANSILSSGRNDLAEAAAIMAISRSTGSFGTVVAGGAQATRLALGGASKIALGLMLKYIGMAIMWLDDLSVETVIKWFK